MFVSGRLCPAHPIRNIKICSVGSMSGPRWALLPKSGLQRFGPPHGTGAGCIATSVCRRSAGQRRIPAPVLDERQTTAGLY